MPPTLVTQICLNFPESIAIKYRDPSHIRKVPSFSKVESDNFSNRFCEAITRKETAGHYSRRERLFLEGSHVARKALSSMARDRTRLAVEALTYWAITFSERVRSTPVRGS